MVKPGRPTQQADKLCVMMLGCGYIAQAEHIPNWLQSNLGTIVAVVDIREGLARRVGCELGVPFFSDAETAFDACECDMVHICTTADSHVALIELAAQRGKHALVEKPLALDSKAAARAIEAARVAKVKLMVGYPRVFDTDLLFVEQQIKEGNLGNVVWAQSVWKLSLPPVYLNIAPAPRMMAAFEEGTPAALQVRFLEESIHHLNLFRRWLGPLASVETVLNTDKLWHVCLTFDGAIPVLHTNSSPIGHGEELWVYGEEQIIHARPWSPHFPWSFGHCEVRAQSNGDVMIPALARRNPYLSIVEEFVASIHEDRPPAPDPGEAVDDILIVEQIVDHFIQHQFPASG
jgi:predicted dehydrogenase